MPLENGTTIAQLDSNWPLGADSATRGDDHIRLIKAVLKAQFPGSGGQGFTKPITITEDELNGIVDAVADVQKSLDAKYPVGRVLLFLDDTDPNGVYPGTWTLVTGDASLSLGDGTSQNVGTVAGENEPNVPVPKHTHNAAFVGNAMPPHGHSISNNTYSWVPGGHGGTSGGNMGTSGHPSIVPASAGTPSGSVTVYESGVDDAKIDVRGARLPVNVWKRVS